MASRPACAQQDEALAFGTVPLRPRSRRPMSTCFCQPMGSSTIRGHGHHVAESARRAGATRRACMEIFVTFSAAITHLSTVGCLEHAALRLKGAGRATKRVSERAANSNRRACSVRAQCFAEPAVGRLRSSYCTVCCARVFLRVVENVLQLSNRLATLENVSSGRSDRQEKQNATVWYRGIDAGRNKCP